MQSDKKKSIAKEEAKLSWFIDDVTGDDELRVCLVSGRNTEEVIWLEGSEGEGLW